MARRQNPKKCCVPASPDQRAAGLQGAEFQFKSFSSASIWAAVSQAIDLVEQSVELVGGFVVAPTAAATIAESCGRPRSHQVLPDLCSRCAR